MNWSRILSSLVAITYIVLALIFIGSAAAFKIGLFVILPLMCIWFSDVMGAYTGFLPLGDYPITQQSPGLLVRIMGWVVLFLPIIAGVIMCFA